MQKFHTVKHLNGKVHTFSLKKGWGMKKLKQKMYETGFKKFTKQYEPRPGMLRIQI